jgi:DNA replication initiation complex subunit (GINS family)
MLNYNDLYEMLRKEKYSEQLQPLSKNFVQQFSEYLSETKKQFSSHSEELFSDELLREKKQFENAFAIFREMMLRRKKKILNLVFVAAETGIMKKDFADMLSFEQELFEKLVRAVEDGDKQMNELLNGKVEMSNKMMLLSEDVEEFVDMSGNVVGPFKKGELVNIDSKVVDILVASSKGKLVDEE